MSNLTISLTGSEVKADFYGNNAWLRNDSAGVVYAGKTAGVAEGVDGVVSIPAGGSAPVYDARGTVFLLGTGSVQLVGSDYSTNPFKTSAQSGGSGADEVARAAISAHAGNSAIHLTSEQLDSAVAGANAYADGKDGETLAAAQTYADSAAENAVSTANAYTDEHAAQAGHTHMVSEITDFPEIPASGGSGVTSAQLGEAITQHNSDENAHAELFAKAAAPAPTAFSVLANAWTELAETVAGCGYSAEIAAEGVTAADYPDVYFDENSLEAAAGIVAGTAEGKVVLYAKTAPATALSGAYFIRKGSAV